MLLNWLKEKLGLSSKEKRAHAEFVNNSHPPAHRTDDIVIEPVAITMSEESPVDNLQMIKRESPEALAYLQKLNTKIDTLAERFANGDLNQRQFERLHDYYRKEIDIIERSMELPMDQQDWKKKVREGQSILIRRANAARLLAFAIYLKSTRQQLVMKGDHTLFGGNLLPLLDEVLKVETQTADGGYLVKRFDQCFVCLIFGLRTITLVVLSEEPSRRQLKTLSEMQAVFETANRNTLGLNPIPNHLLAIPINFFLGKEL